MINPQFNRLSRVFFYVFLVFTILSTTSPVYAGRPDRSEHPEQRVIEINPDSIPSGAGTRATVKQAVSDELIIKYKSDLSTVKRRQLRDRNNLQTENLKRDSLKKRGTEKVRLSRPQTPEELEQTIGKLEQDPEIDYAEPNYILEVQSDNSFIPDDPGFPKQWPLSSLDLPKFWSQTMGDQKIVIAVLDTGVDMNNVDKPEHILSGYDFVNDDFDPQDDHGHGTYISGIIAAATNNSQGVAGLCPDCSVLPVKIMDSTGLGTYADTANAILWAADQGADIINLSIGGYAYSKTLEDAIKYAQQKGILVIAAGGNHGIAVPMYPAYYDNVIGVSAIDKNNLLWPGSNTGPHISISAPGVGVYGMDLYNKYNTRTGSSVSTAFVSGIAALLLSQNISLTNTELAQQLFDSAIDLGAEGKDESYGVGGLAILSEKNAIGQGEDEKKDEEMPEKGEDSSTGTDSPTDVLDENEKEEIEKPEGGDDGLFLLPDDLFQENDIAPTSAKLDKFPNSTLNNYKNDWESFGQKYDAQYAISNAVMQNISEILGGDPEDDFIIEGGIYLTLLDIKWHVVTSNTISAATLKNDLKELIYEDFSDYKFRAGDDSLADLMLGLGYKLSRFYKEYPEKNEILFKNGLKIQASEGTNKATYAVMKMMAKMAENQQEWKLWLGEGEESFRKTWEKIVGVDPTTYKMNIGETELSKKLGDNITVDLVLDRIFQQEASVAEIQEFLNSQNNVLKKYGYFDENTKGYLAARYIHSISLGGMIGERFNSRLIPVVLELAHSVITNPDLTVEDMQNIFDITRQQYAELLKSQWRFCRTDQEDYNCMSRDWFESEIKNRDLFFMQLDYTFSHLDNAEDFKNLLKNLADSDQQYQHWMSFEEGSFFSLYDKWFGLPMDLIESQKTQEISTQTTEIIEPPKVDFLKSAYNKLDNCGINSFFDHQSPVYTKEKKEEVNNTVLFTGKELDFYSLVLGYNSYSGHNGIDALVRDCKTLEGKSIFAAADGVVLNVINYGVDKDDGYGNYVEIEHDLNNDGYPDYRTRYGHLKEKSALVVGDSVQEGKIIGIAGTTGKSTGVHLHFDVTSLIYTKNKEGKLVLDEPKSKVIDPLGWWGDYPDPWQEQNSYAKSAFLFESSSLVDDMDHAFFAFNKQGSPWNQLDAVNAYKDHALYTYGMYQPVRTWDNWGFWGGKIEEAGKYTVSAFIPDYPIEGKEVSEEAIYRIYHKGGYDDKVINQKEAVGGWVFLGDYEFEAGTKAAVRLIDEVKSTDQAGKVIWADAIRWTKSLTKEQQGPDLKFIVTNQDKENDDPPDVLDEDFQFIEFKPTDIDPNYKYEITVKVKNNGNAPAWDAEVCFDPGLFSSCLGSGKIESFLLLGESRVVQFSFITQNALTGNHLGTLKFKKGSIFPVELEGGDKNNQRDLFANQLVSFEGKNQVEFSFAELGGIQIDDDTDQVKIMIRAEKAGKDSSVIDLSAAKSEMTKVFLQALAIPNSKHHISLDILPSGDDYVGQANVPLPFEQTDTADSFLKADVAMKFDLFGPKNNNLHPYAKWTELIQASPYWNELSSRGFDRYPDWVIAATIVPGEINARQTGNDFFLEDIKLDINAGWWMREPTVDSGGLGLSQAARDDVKNRLSGFKEYMEEVIKNKALQFTIPELNAANPADERFRKLRSVYAALAAAQWYKEQVKIHPDLPYADLIDSEDLAGIGMEQPFDWGYWNDQAWQHLGTIQDMTFNGPQNWEARGGASLEKSEPEITGPLTAEQNEILSKVIGQFETAKSGDSHYIFGGSISTPKPDLTLGEITTGCGTDCGTSCGANGGESCGTDGGENDGKFLMGTSISLDIGIMNAGPVESGEVTLKIYDRIAVADSEITEPIAEVNLGTLAPWAEITHNLLWQLPDVAGVHRIVAELDSEDHVNEMNESNNVTQAVVTVTDPHPVVTILTPQSGSVLHPDGIVFEATAYDALKGEIKDASAYTWQSSLDGNLGEGTALTMPSLSEGDHQITLTVMGPHAVSTSQTFPLYVRPLGVPTVKIQSPINGHHYSKELSLSFSGVAEDNEDGVLDGDSLLWHSDVDGDLGYGSSVSALLSEGEHEITLTATDSDEEASSAKISIVVETGTPVLSVSSPADGSLITEGESTPFITTVTDIQEGDLSANLLWSSDKDGFLGKGDFEKIMSIGTHHLTAMVVDHDGLKAVDERTVTVQNTPPEVVLVAPADKALFNFGTSVSFEGSATDLQDGLLLEDALSWSSDRDGVLGTGTHVVRDNLSPGNHVITLTVIDTENLPESASIQITIDAGAPDVVLLQPAVDQSFVFGSDVTLKALVTDDEEGDLDGESVVWSSNPDGLLGTGATLIVNQLSIGTHEIRVEAKDSQGWKTSAVRNIIIKPLEPPSATILFPKNGGSYSSGQPIYFYGASGDPEDGLLSGEHLKWSSDLNGELGQGNNFSRSDLAVGQHTVTFTAADSHGLQAISTIQFTITPLPPSVSITAPSDGTVVKIGESITFTGEGAENLSWQSALDGALGTGASLTVSHLTLGSHLITLTGINADNNPGQATITVVVVDESSLQISGFSEGQKGDLLDFTSAQDHTLNVSVPKDATVDNAQVSLHAQKGMEMEVQTQFFQILSEQPVDEQEPIVEPIVEAIVERIVEDEEVDPSVSTRDEEEVGKEENKGDSVSEAGMTNGENAPFPDNVGATPESPETGNENGEVDPSVGTRDEEEEGVIVGDDNGIDSGSVAGMTNDGNNPPFVETQDVASPEDMGDEQPDDQNSVGMSDQMFGDNNSRADDEMNFEPQIPEFFETTEGAVELLNPNASEESLGIQSSDIQLKGHGISTGFNSAWPYAPLLMDKFYQGDQVQCWVYFTSSSGGYWDMDRYYVDKYGNEYVLDTFPVGSPEQTGISFGPGEHVFKWGCTLFGNPGNYKDKLWFKSSFQPEWEHYSTLSYSVNEKTNEAPQISVSHSPDTIMENNPVTLSMNCKDNSDYVDWLDLHWNSGAGWQKNPENGPVGLPFIFSCSQASGNIFNTTIGPFPEETVVQYYGTATDFNGNTTTTETKAFTILDNDTTGPSVTSIVVEEGDGADGDGVIDESEPVRIYWKASDPSGIQSAQLFLDGAPQVVENQGALYFSNLSPLSWGEHVYSIIAADADNSPAGTTVNGDFSVTRLPFLLNPSLDAGQDGVIDWSIDGDMTQDSVTGNFAAAINTYLQNHSAETDGKVKVPLYFHVDEGNVLRVNNLNIAYRIVDTVPPALSNVIINPEVPEAGKPVTVTVTAIDNTAVTEVKATLADHSVVLVRGDDNVFSGMLTAPESGMFDLTITATDESGLITTSITPVTIVSFIPELTVESVTFTPESPLLTGQTVQADVLLRNTGNQTVNTEVSLTHVIPEIKTISIPATGTALLQTSFTLPDPGQHTLDIHVDSNNQWAEEDETNNAFSHSYQTVDGTPPGFEQITIPQQIGSGQNFDVITTVMDNVGLQNVRAQWLGQSYGFTNEDSTYTAHLTAPDSLGESVITLIAEDQSGLTTTVQKTVNVIDITPNPSVQSPHIISIPDSILPLETPVFQITLKNDGGSAVDTPVQITLDGQIVHTQSMMLPAGQPTALTWSEWQATSGSHQLIVTLDPGQIITEKNEGDNSGTFDFIVPYTLPPTLKNLVLPTNVLSGESFTIAADVTGDQELKEVIISINGENHFMTSVDNITYSFAGALPVGDYPLAITATNLGDLTGQLSGKLIIHPALPDLSIPSFQASLAAPTNLETTQFTVTLRNNGYVDATTIPVLLQLDGALFAEKTVDLATQSSEVWIVDWPAKSGEHLFEVTMDPGNTISEIDETDNTVSFPVSVTNVVPPVITGVTAPDIVFSNEIISIKAVVQDSVPVNITATIGESVATLVFEDDLQLYIGGLSVPHSIGESVLTVEAQNEDGLTNVWQKTITILDSNPDLSIAGADVLFNPSSLVAEESASITTVIHNHGGTDVKNADVQLKINDQAVSTQTVSIAKSNQETLTWEWIPSFGMADIAIVLDPNNGIAESDELNNQYATSLYAKDIIAPSSPQLQVTDGAAWSSKKDWHIAWPEVEESHLAGYAYQLDGGLWKDIGLTTYIDIHFDQAGKHAVCVRAEDLSGNQNPSCTSINLDFLGPLAPVLKGGTSQWSADSHHKITWNAPFDDGSGVVSYLLRINGTITGLGLVNAYEENLDDGEYLMQIAALDSLDHQSMWSNLITLRVDATSPGTVQNFRSATHPSGVLWFANGTPEFTWDPPADTSGIEGYYHYIDHNQSTIPNSQYWFTDKNKVTVPVDQALGSGEWFFHIIPVDNVGNPGITTHAPFNIDLAPPFTAISLSPNSNKIVLSATDEFTSVASTHYRLDGGNWISGDFFFLPKSGDHQIEYYSIDQLENTEGVKQVSIDLEKPSSPLIGPHSANWTNAPLQTVSWQEPLTFGAGLKEYLVRIDGVEIISAGTATSLAHTFTDGTHLIDVAAVDILGEQSDWSGSMLINVDVTSPPSVSSISSASHPDSIMWYTDPTPEFSWNSVYDTLSGTFGYRYTIDHDSKTLLTSSDPFTEATTFSQSTPLSGGTWYFHVAAVDNAHNIGNVSFDFQINIDTTPPEVDIDVNSYPLRIGATDEHSGVQTVFFRVDDKDWQIGTEVRFSISGSHIVEFYATDQLNNTSAVESVKFTYSPGSKWSWNRIKQQQEEQEALATEQEAIKKSKEEYEKQELERPYSFENLKVFYAFDKALISWNNVNTSIDYFVVYRCALTDPDCQKPTVVAQIQSNSEKRMRVIDRIGGQHYYRVFGYFADDQILEKSEVVFYKQSFERKTLLKNKKEVGKL